MQTKIRTKFYPFLCLILGAALVAGGIYTLTAKSLILSVACYIGGAAAAIHGLSLFISTLSKKKKFSKAIRGSLYTSVLFNIALGLILILLPFVNMIPVYVIFVIYIFVNAIVKLLDYFIDKKDNVSGRWKELVGFLFFLVFGVLMIFVPGMGERGFLVVTGIYCVLYGAFLIADFIYQCLPLSVVSRINRKMSLPMPILISTLLPFVNLKQRDIKKILDPDSEKEDFEVFFPEGKETDEQPDLEVMVHVSEKGMGIMGHTDIYFDGEILSYGSYDLPSTYLFGGIGDGIFVIGKKEPYIRFYVTNSPREIYSYGFHLTEEQKKAVKNEIDELKSIAYPWEPPLQQVLRNDPDAKGEAATDWGSRLWNCSGADFFKFKSGKMKTYFVLTSNCVMMTDRIVRKACADTTTPRKVLTPGGYYDYLEHILAMSNSPVFCRRIYNKNSTSNWTYTPRAEYSDNLAVITETQANRIAVEKQGKKMDRKRRKAIKTKLRGKEKNEK